ncbi:DUF1254 domain-containing protein [Bradyrhizobium iriomotense]|uniref:DUF1254 domain-containing protein n=1 Tax=Bradyrhizobium iriomotense TaxID=441950 RepID=A0ABQ6B256_9BRAD|nr:hypothetical protein GCM10007857_52210 [Bradyrhizobium iriomotense]
MRRTIVGAIAIMLVTASAYAQDRSSEDLNARNIQRRAVEAMIWAMPAVNTDLMLQAMLTSTKAKVNEIVYWSKPVNWKNQTLTPNPDAIYLMSFWNVKDGPIVIEIPPAQGGSIAGNIVTAWQMPLEDAGPEGADKGQGGKYLILPPGYKGEAPAGYIALQSDTFSGFALLRSNLAGHGDADVAKSVAMASWSRSIRSLKLKIRCRPTSRTPMMSCSIPRFPMTQASIATSTAWCRTSPGSIAIEP